MFGSKQRGKVIPKGLKIVGSVTAEGLVEVDGSPFGQSQIERHQNSITTRLPPPAQAGTVELA